MRYIKFLWIFGIVSLTSCHKDAFEPYDQPFVHIMKNGLSAVSVSARGTSVETYSVYLSSKALTENLTVDFGIITGEGLVAGADFELLTTGNQLVFPPGIYEMPVRIRWVKNPVDESEDNTLKIVLLGNSMGFTLGLPGPDGKQKEFVITKVN